MTGEGKTMLGNSISGVIFDLDGTLADTSPDIAAALNAALREAGQKPLPVPDVITMIGGGIPTLVKRAIARLGAKGALQALRSKPRGWKGSFFVHRRERELRCLNYFPLCPSPCGITV